MKNVFPAFLALCVLCLSAFRLAEAPARDFLAALGLTQTDAEAFVFQSFWTEYATHPTGERVRSLIVGDRPAMVREVVQFAKKHTASAGFRDRYAQLREESRPKPPSAPGSGQEMVDAQKADLKKQIAEIEAQAAASPSDVKAMLLETAGMLKEQMALLDDPNNPYLDPDLQQAMAQGSAEELAAYEVKLAEWERLFPEDPKGRIAARLERTLALCADVDFSAKLVDGKDGLRVFANPALEAKPYEWKACYRAGPDAVAAARAALSEWLAELR